MASITRRQLVDMAAVKVGALGAGQVLEAEDLSLIQQYASALFDQLQEDDILHIGDQEQIPASWSPYLATLLGNLIGPDFGTPFDVTVKLGTESILRRMVRATPTYERQTTEYF
jgi:hypothetical protein